MTPDTIGMCIAARLKALYCVNFESGFLFIVQQLIRKTMQEPPLLLQHQCICTATAAVKRIMCSLLTCDARETTLTSVVSVV